MTVAGLPPFRTLPVVAPRAAHRATGCGTGHGSATHTVKPHASWEHRLGIGGQATAVPRDQQPRGRQRGQCQREPTQRASTWIF